MHRTANIQDAEVLAKVESEIVERALHWDGLSKQKLDDAIDAAYADFDHTVPWPAGPTHASGGKLLCRRHHLAKTFWPGWSEIQHPDGTVIWTTPTGRTYTTKPGSALLFPTVNTTSAPIDIHTATHQPRQDQDDAYSAKRNRAKAINYRINAERALNDAYVAERNKPPPF